MAQVSEQRPSAKGKILLAALAEIRARGYAATTVDDLCAAAGVTKGAFFHHFKSKDELAIAAAHHWTEITGDLFAAAPYHEHADPLEVHLRPLLRGFLQPRDAVGEAAVLEVLVAEVVELLAAVGGALAIDLHHD